MNEEIIAMIPARMGSTRLAKKNLVLLGGKPLIFYAINSAKKSGVFKKIYINSENEVFGKMAERYKVEFYHRPNDLGSSNAKSDGVIYDFMKNISGDILVWVNSIAPLQTGDEIKKVVRYFIENDFDSLITVKDENVHCIIDGKPINFNLNGPFAKTQDIITVQPFVYSLMMWKYDIFMKNFEKQGYALMGGKLGFYSIDKMSSVIIKKEEDLRFAEYVLTGMKERKDYKIKYDELVK